MNTTNLLNSFFVILKWIIIYDLILKYIYNNLKIKKKKKLKS